MGHRTGRRLRGHAGQPLGFATARPDSAQGCGRFLAGGPRQPQRIVRQQPPGQPAGGAEDQDRLLFGDQELLFHNPAAFGIGHAASGHGRSQCPHHALHTHNLTTIVVVDIRDFTPLARTVSEALLSQTIGTWFLKVGQVTQRQGSWAQRYIGDAVMAVWVHDDRARVQADLMRALRAVDEINMATAEISRTLPLPGPTAHRRGRQHRSAILGGTEYTALGDTVNAAFRLEAATKTIGLSVALGERTYAELGQSAQGLFLRREVALKGCEGLKTAWGISFEELRRFLENRP